MASIAVDDNPLTDIQRLLDELPDGSWEDDSFASRIFFGRVEKKNNESLPEEEKLENAEANRKHPELFKLLRDFGKGKSYSTIQVSRLEGDVLKVHRGRSQNLQAGEYEITYFTSRNATQNDVNLTFEYLIEDDCVEDETLYQDWLNSQIPRTPGGKVDKVIQRKTNQLTPEFYRVHKVRKLKIKSVCDSDEVSSLAESMKKADINPNSEMAIQTEMVQEEKTVQTEMALEEKAVQTEMGQEKIAVQTEMAQEINALQTENDELDDMIKLLQGDVAKKSETDVCDKEQEESNSASLRTIDSPLPEEEVEEESSPETSVEPHTLADGQEYYLDAEGNLYDTETHDIAGTLDLNTNTLIEKKEEEEEEEGDEVEEHTLANGQTYYLGPDGTLYDMETEEIKGTLDIDTNSLC
jgi:hypothetical protein